MLQRCVVSKNQQNQTKFMSYVRMNFQRVSSSDKWKIPLRSSRKLNLQKLAIVVKIGCNFVDTFCGKCRHRQATVFRSNTIYVLLALQTVRTVYFRKR